MEINSVHKARGTNLKKPSGEHFGSREEKLAQQ